jgi:sigma-E factor negative regulatory protein RseB
MKRKRLYCVALTLVVGCLSAAGWTQPAAEDAKRWLERMIQATQTLNYEGTFIYIQGPHVEAMRIVHGCSPDGERQLLISLNGPLREVVVAGHSVTRLAPDHSETFASADFQRSPFPLSIPRDLSRLESHYEFELLGEDRIAGLAARVIAIKPRDAWRYGYRIWLDQRHGIMLRSALLDGKGYPIEQLMFTDLQIKPNPDLDKSVPEPQELQPEVPREPSQRDKRLPAGEPVTRSAWHIAELPKGFAKVLHNRFTKSPGQRPTEHLVFADGLATISVFLERLDGAPPLLRGGSQLGSMSAFGTVVEDHQVLVVGEVPAATVQHIATSIQHEPEAESSD